MTLLDSWSWFLSLDFRFLILHNTETLADPADVVSDVVVGSAIAASAPAFASASASASAFARTTARVKALSSADHPNGGTDIYAWPSELLASSAGRRPQLELEL